MISMFLWLCGSKPRPGGHAVFVDHPQRTHAHVGRIVVVAERESVLRAQPAETGDTAILAFTDVHHDHSP
jgi:hypothetical protein